MWQQKNKGFTLFEVLIASTLIAVLFTGIVSFTTTLLSGTTSAQKKLEITEEIYTTFLAIEKDILALTHQFKADSFNKNEDIYLVSFYRTMPKTGPYAQNGSTISIKYWISENMALEKEFSLPKHKKLTTEGISQSSEESKKTVTLYRESFDPKFSEKGQKKALLTAKEITFSFKDKNKTSVNAWRSSEHPTYIEIQIIDTLNRTWKRTLPVLIEKGIR